MELSSDEILSMLDNIVIRIEKLYSKEHNVSLIESKELFEKSETYKLLYDLDFDLWTESSFYILHTFEAEISGDVKEFERYAYGMC